MAHGATSSITTRFLVELLDQAGQPADDLLRSAGLARSALSSPELRCPLAEFDQLWARAAALQPDIGLRLIDRFPPGQMHVVTHLAMRAASVREALQSVQRYVSVTQEDDRISLSIDGDRCALIYHNPPMSAGRRRNPWLVEHFLSMAHVLFASACGRPLPLHQVSFVAAPQAAPEAYAQRFGQAPQFLSTLNALVFAADALDWPLLTQDAYLRGVLEQFASDRLPPPGGSIELEVLTKLRTAWLSGKPPELAQIAAELRLSAAQLRRRLADCGCNFRQLKDQSRRDLARTHLQSTLSIGEIAYLLGFSEAAALQHACKRWFGKSAGELRSAS